MTTPKILCVGTSCDGELCSKTAGKTGYCRDCDPTTKKELVRKQVLKDAEKALKQEQRQEIFQQELDHMITECQTLDDLRKLELKIMQGLIDGSIDPRAGTPVTSILKHQETLIKTAKGNEDLKPNERDKAVALAKEMSNEQMLGLIGDLAHGMGALVKRARIEAQGTGVFINVEAKELA